MKKTYSIYDKKTKNPVNDDIFQNYSEALESTLRWELFLSFRKKYNAESDVIFGASSKPDFYFLSNNKVFDNTIYIFDKDRFTKEIWFPYFFENYKIKKSDGTSDTYDFVSSSTFNF